MLSNSKLYKVKKLDLLARMQENKIKHLETYERAQVKYREKVAAELDTLTVRVKEGKKFSLSALTTLERPHNYSPEYDKVIGLLTMTSDDVIEITPQDYEQFVLDNWSWKASFLSNATSYGVASDDEVGSSAED